MTIYYLIAGAVCLASFGWFIYANRVDNEKLILVSLLTCCISSLLLSVPSAIRIDSIDGKIFFSCAAFFAAILALGIIMWFIVKSFKSKHLKK